MPDIDAAWAFLPYGYVLTVLIEIPILLLGLSKRHTLRDRFIAGLLLTAFTYPVVIIVLPPLVWAPYGRFWYLVIAETFAPLAECLLFWLFFGSPTDRTSNLRDCAVIIAANLASFGFGLLLQGIL